MKNFNLNNLNSPDYEFLFGEKRMVYKDPVASQPDAEPKKTNNIPSKAEKGPETRGKEGAKVDEVKKQTVADIARAKVEMEGQKKRNELKEKLKKIEAKVKGPQDKNNPITKKDAKDAGKISHDADKYGNEELSAQAADMEVKVNQKIVDEKIFSAEELDKASKYEKKENLTGLHFFDIGIRIRENPRVNPDRWTAFSAGELETVKKEWQILGIYKENPFYRNIFHQLSKCYDPSFFEKDKAKAKLLNYRSAFQHPDQAKDNIDSEFRSALSFFNFIKLESLKRVEGKTNTDESNQKKDDDPIFTRAKHVVQDNINKFKEAIQNKDYTTAGIYVLGCYAAFKLYKGMDEKSKGDYKKYFFWAAAIYTGHIFAKNAGYNIAKKLGLESIDSELKGTPFASLYKLDVLDKKVEIDNNLFKGISIVKVSDLYNKYQESNSQSPNFIDPNHFPWATGEKFGHLTYRDIMKTTSLNRNEQKYKQAGQQLYILTQAFEKGYMKTIGRDSPTVSFAQALKMPALKNMTVMDLMNEFARYALNRGDQSLFTDNISKEMNSRIIEVGKMQDLGIGALALNKRGDYETTAMGGFPIVLRRNVDDKAIYVFAKKDYENDEKLSKTGIALASIPFTGNAGNAMQDLRDGITDKMRDLMQPLEFGSGKKAEAPAYNGQMWTANITLAESPRFGLKEEVVKATIKPREDGLGVFVNLAGGRKISVSESLSKQGDGFRMIQKVLDTKEFGILGAFAAVDRIKYKEVEPEKGKDPEFILEIGKDNLKITFRYNKNTEKIELANPTQVKELIRNYPFAKEYSEALADDKYSEFSKAMTDFRNLVEKTPQAYFSHLGHSIVDGWLKLDFNVSDFTGAIPKNYVLGLVDAQKLLIVSKLTSSLKSANSLADISRIENEVMTQAYRDLNELNNRYAGLNVENYQKGDKFSRKSFNAEILTRLSKIGIKSVSYNDWYRQFIDKMYLMHGMDNLRRNDLVANQLVAVFSYYTAHLDDPAVLDGVDTNLTITKQMKDDTDAVLKVFENLKNVTSKEPVDNIDSIIAECLKLFPKNKDLQDKNYVLLLLDKDKQIKKYKKYSLYLAYVNHVKDQIYRKLPVTSTLPGPGGDWGILPWKEFETRHKFAAKESVDSTPRLKMAKDYITIDKYLAKSPVARQKIDKSQIVLPRGECNIILTGTTPQEINEQSDLLTSMFKVLQTNPKKGVIFAENIKRTALEEEFYKRVQFALDELSKEHKTTKNFDTAVKARHFTMRFHLKLVSRNSGIETYEFRPVKSDFYKEMDDLEQKFALRDYRTLTHSDQISEINNAVMRIADKYIRNKEFYPQYFPKESITGWLKNLGRKLKSKLPPWS